MFAGSAGSPAAGADVFLAKMAPLRRYAIWASPRIYTSISPMFPAKLSQQVFAFTERLVCIGVLVAVFLAAGAHAADPPAPVAAPEQAEKSPELPPGYGSHGMAVFGGRDGLYASHLPMFHAPHDAQVLIRFHLADASVDAHLRAQLALRPRLWTLDPESFDLHRLQPGNAEPLTQFNARFVQGHFERNGLERFTGQTVLVDEVMLFKHLDFKSASAGAVPHSAGRYLLLGSGREYFAVKEIDRRPDFDVIVAMKPHPSSRRPVGERTTLLQPFMLPTNDLKEPHAAALQAALQGRFGRTLQVGKMLYFETEDLK